VPRDLLILTPYNDLVMDGLSSSDCTEWEYGCLPTMTEPVTIYAGPGADQLKTGNMSGVEFNKAPITFYAGSGNDRLLLRGSGDTVYASSGADYIELGGGGDYPAGGIGNDVIYGEPGADELNPRLRCRLFFTAAKGTDTLNGGPGVDTVKQ
jgi:Ca2+-binding RTX toxin-like protein